MRILDAIQGFFAKRVRLIPVTLVKLELFSARDAETVGETFYLSTRPVVYDYGNTGTDRDFWPLIRSIGDLVATMSHLPLASDLGLLRKSLTLELSNETWQGTRLSTTLRANYLLENARVELSQILLENPAANRIDLSSLGGDEHTVLYRGRVQTASPIDEERIVLECDLDVPTMQWLRAEDAATVLPQDVGVRLPVVYGAARRVRCVGLTTGWTTTLAEPLNDSQTGNFEVTDAGEGTEGMPDSGSFTVTIGREDLTVTKVSATTLNSTVRGLGDTNAAPHQRGEGVLEVVDPVTFGIMGHPGTMADELYMRAPAFDDLVRLRSGDYSHDIANMGAFPGEVVSSVAFTAAQIAAIFDELFTDITLDTETPNLIDDPPTISIQTSDPDIVSSPSNPTHRDVNSTPDFHFDATAATEDWFKARFPTSHFANPTDEVVRWRLILKWTGTAKKGIVPASRFRISVKYQNIGDTGAPAIAGSPPESEFANWFYNGGTTINGPQEYTGPWHIPTATVTLSDFEASSDTVGWRMDVRGWNHRQGASAVVSDIGSGHDTDFAAGWGIEFEITQTSTAVLSGGAFGFGLELFADVQGYKVDLGSGHVHKNDVTDYALSRSAWNKGDDDLDWNIISPDTGSIADDAVVEVDGSSVAFTVTNADSEEFFVRTDAFAAGVDWTGKWIQFRTQWTDSLAVGSDMPHMEVRLYSGGATDAAHTRVYADLDMPKPIPGFPLDEWHTVVVDIDNTLVVTEGGSFDVTDVDRVGITWASIIDETATVWIDEPEVGDPAANPYKASDGALIEHPADVFRHFITEILGGTVDETSVVAAETDLGSDVLAIDLRTLGLTTEEILTGLGFHSRANPVLEEFVAGSRWKLLTANRLYQFDPSTTQLFENDQTDHTTNLVNTSIGHLAVDWISGPSSTITDDAVIEVDGSSVKFAFTGLALPPNFILSFGANEDWTGKSLQIRFRWNGTEETSAPADKIEVRIQSTDSLSPPKALIWLRAPAADPLPEDQWHTMIFDLAQPDTRGADFDITDVSAIIIIAHGIITGTADWWIDEPQLGDQIPGIVPVITEWSRNGIAEAGRRIDQLGTRFIAHYAPDPSIQGGSDDVFRQVALANPDQSDVPETSAGVLATRERNFGRIDAQPYAFPGIQDEETAEDVLGYYVHERSRISPLYAIEGVPWWEAYDIEVGDIQSVTPPWESSARKVRVLEYRKSFDTEQVSLRVVEVE